MTSTVLDVTIMLLCVSASVVALGGAGSDPFGSGNSVPDVERTTDRLTTETATVTYDVDDSYGESTVHATLVELLVMVAWIDVPERAGAGNPVDGGSDTFTSKTRSIVSNAFGPRTRIDVRPGVEGTGDGKLDVGSPRVFGGDTPRDRDTLSVGSEPPRGATVTTAVATTPVPDFVSTEYDRAEIVVRVW